MKIRASLTIRQKIMIFTVIGVVSAVAVFGIIGTRAVNQATEAMLEDRMIATELVAGYLDEILRSSLAELVNTAQAIEENTADEQTINSIGDLEETYKRLTISVHNIYLIGETGDIIWSKFAGPELIGNNISSYPVVNRIVEENESAISGLTMAPGFDVPVVLLSSSIHSGYKDDLCDLVVAVNLIESNIGGFIKPIRLGDTGYVEIVDQNGVVLVRTDPGPELSPFEKSEHSGRFAELIAEGEPTRGLCHTCHEPIQKVERRDILAFVPLVETHWGVVIRQSEEEALAPINEMRQNLILYGAILAAVAFVFVIFVTRDVIRRLSVLTAASQQIAEGDLTSSIDITKTDEVGILEETFEDMRAKLKLSSEEINKRTNELSSLLSVSEILSHLPDLSDLGKALDSALEKTLEIMGERNGSICLLDEEKKRLTCRVNQNLYKNNVPVISYRLGEGISGRAAKNGEAIIVEDITKDPRLLHGDLFMSQEFKGFSSVPLRSKDKVLGVVNVASYQVRKFTSDDVRLLEGIARIIAAAVENASLHQEVQSKEIIRGELLQDMFSIQEEERKRIARELHDETSQVLSSVNANLEAAINRLPDNTDSNIESLLRKAQVLQINMLDEIHKLIYELRPSLLDDMGLVPAIRWLIENNLEPVGIAAEFNVTGKARRMPSQIETTLFRVVQEALNNIVKHASAESVTIDIRFKRKTIVISIHDDGTGFNLNGVMSLYDRPRGLGLLGMKERVSLVNGVFEIRSNPGQGTTINIEIPLNKEVSDEHYQSNDSR